LRAFLDAAPVAETLLPALPSAPPPAVHTRLRVEREEAGVRVYRMEAGTPLLVRTALKGTALRSAEQIAEEGELLGGSVGAGVASESFGWSISVPARYAAEAVALLADVAQHPTVPDDALDTERTIALSDLSALRDDMYRYPVRLATAAAFAGHPYGVPLSGDETTLPCITPERVRGWHSARFLNGPSVIAVVGDADHDELAAMMAAQFGERRGGEPMPLEHPDWPRAVVQRIEQRDKAQTAVALLFPGPSRTDDARFAAEMIANVASGLGGRFFDELRDKQSLGYAVQAFASERTLAGSFVSYIATSPERDEVARRGLLAEFAKLREAPVTAEEMLAVARAYFDESRRVEDVVRGVGRAV
jgi:zinc protease